MRYINMFEQQLAIDNKVRNKVYDTKYFDEYVALNCFLNDFKRSKQRIREIIQEDIDSLHANELSKIKNVVDDLCITINKVINLNHPLFNHTKINGVIFLLGDSTVDSHGILIAGKAYLVIDVLAFMKGQDFYNPYSFIVHEYTHCIHYMNNHEMYFRNINNRSDGILKRIIVEGFATFVTKQITGEDDHIVFWLGYLNEKEIALWIKYSEDLRPSIGLELKDVIKDNTYQTLFSVCDSENIWKGRLAYYYGYKIAERLSQMFALEELLRLPFEYLQERIEEYFSENTICSI